MPSTASTTKTSSPALIGLAWLVVLIPTGWGLNYTIQNALKIFTKATPAATAPASPAPTTLTK